MKFYMLNLRYGWKSAPSFLIFTGARSEADDAAKAASLARII